MFILDKQHLNHKNGGTTLVELVVAVSMMVVITTTVLAMIAPLRRTFDVQTHRLDTLQNGRILIDALVRELSQARQINVVSNAADETGYIEYTNNAQIAQRFEINATNNYVQFGPIDSLQDLAGPVSQLQFTCFDPCDFDTPTADANEIRYIEIETTILNTGDLGQDMTFSTGVFIYSDGVVAVTSELEGWWCLDDATGTTASDSSGHGRHGTLENMAGDEWTTGVLNGALEFNGYADHVELPIGEVIAELTDCTISAWVNWSGLGNVWQRVFDFGSSTTDYMYFMPKSGDSYTMRFAITDGGYSNEDRTSASEPLETGWHHLAVTIDDVNTTHTLYIDGEVVGQNTSATTNPSDLGETSNNWLGFSQYGYPYFDGILDDVRLYSRAFSAQEVSNLVSEVPWVHYRDFEEAKTTAAQSLTIPTPGSTGSASTGDPIAYLGEETASPFTVPSGSNRLLILTCHVEDNDEDIELEAVTYGGQAMTKIKEEIINESGNRAYVVAYRLNESGIASASGNTFSPTWSSRPDSGSYFCFAVENVNQASPIGDMAADTDANAKTLSTQLSTRDGDLAILAATAGRAGTYDVYGGFREMEQLDISSADAVIGYKRADGSDVYPEVYHNNPNRQVLIGFVIQQGGASAAPVTTIEGDLLIAVVATDGDETISEPSGEDWTLLSLGTGDGRVTLGVWAKLASASESGSHTFTWTSDEEAYGWIMRFQGHDPSNPLNVMDSLEGAATWNPPSPSVTTSVANTMILRIGGFEKNYITLDDTGLAGHTTITMDTSSTGYGSASGGAAYEYQQEPGSSGSDTFDLTAGEEYGTVTIAIAPDGS